MKVERRRAMLVECPQKAITTGGDELEIECRYWKECFTAFSGALGLGTGSLDSNKAKPIFEELAELRKKKRVTVGNRSYSLRFHQFESFGETGHRIQVKEIKSNKWPARHSTRLATEIFITKAAKLKRISLTMPWIFLRRNGLG
jgi:hypothetical protein